MVDNKGKHATIVDVADLAKVSVATVGRALGDYGYVHPETKAAILVAAQALNYKKNIAAQSLASGRANTIGIIVSDIGIEFYSNIIKSVMNYSRKRGYCVLIYDTHESVEIEREAVSVFQKHRVDGIIVSPANSRKVSHLREFMATGGQIVQIDRRIRGLKSDTVTLDNRKTARDCTAKILAAGHQKIAYIGELEEILPSALQSFVENYSRTDTRRPGFAPSFQRLLGYLDAHHDAKKKVYFDLIGRTGHYSPEAAEKATLRVLKGQPTALLTSNGLMTVGAFRAIHVCQKRIPEDISFVSFDDLEWLQFVEPPISAVIQPCMKIGAEAARILISRAESIKSNDRVNFEHIRMNGTMIDRGSIRRLS